MAVGTGRGRAGRGEEKQPERDGSGAGRRGAFRQQDDVSFGPPRRVEGQWLNNAYSLAAIFQDCSCHAKLEIVVGGLRERCLDILRHLYANNYPTYFEFGIQIYSLIISFRIQNNKIFAPSAGYGSFFDLFILLNNKSYIWFSNGKHEYSISCPIKPSEITVLFLFLRQTASPAMFVLCYISFLFILWCYDSIF